MKMAKMTISKYYVRSTKYCVLSTKCTEYLVVDCANCADKNRLWVAPIQGPET